MKPDTPNVAAAAAEIKNMQRAFRAFGEADNIIAVLENLDQIAKERQAAADAATAKMLDAQGELTKAISDTDAAKQEAKDIRATAKEKAAGIVEAAQAKADTTTTTIGEAQEKARKDIAELTEYKAELDAAVAAMKARLEELRPTVERAERIAAAV
jgi:chromosome segregation ATPase